MSTFKAIFKDNETGLSTCFATSINEQFILAKMPQLNEWSDEELWRDYPEHKSEIQIWKNRKMVVSYPCPRSRYEKLKKITIAKTT